ncbi:hypothetical protein Bca52824_032118 [Brassica carinata]|uniref:VQ domain-containing protein n=1 Tax=Brassica carinata TaxID=52824 RepID=A0A8X7V604_BRACI|nr:hypothetical protein Bca52824_032118 [Brassica carinata]
MDNKSPRSKEILGPRPTPLKIRKDSHKIIKKPPLAPQPRLQPPQSQPPQLHEQEPSQLLPPRGPVIIYTVSPKIIHTHPNNFMTLVQRLTGKTSTSTIPSSSSPSTLPLDYTSASRDTSAVFDASRGSISPAARYAAMEKANVSSELGFVGFPRNNQEHHHQNRTIERAGILSPGPASLQPISPDFFSTVGASDPQGLSSFFNEFSSILQATPSTSTSPMELFTNFFDS